MDGQAGISQIDVNRGLRDRLGRNQAAETSVRQAAQLTLAVALNDLQDLARSRFTTQPDDSRR